ncbi:hypothetical protein IP88_11330 [alpha proteobacterium AAP81b]|nr:hypothetical protein IP88_11330 [alpha proteobacterium AAP81b]
MRFPAASALAIAARARSRRFPARQVILRQDDIALDVLLLVAGRARVRHLSLDGRLVSLHDLGPGDLFGRIDPSRPRQAAEVAAIEAVTAALFGGGDFVALTEQHGSLALLLAQSLLRRLASLSDQLIARTTLSATGRVHAELLRLAGTANRIAPPPVLTELAAAVDTTRETVSRTISTLERRGIIARDAAALTILVPRRLEELVI